MPNKYESLRPNLVDLSVGVVAGLLYAHLGVPTPEAAIALSPIVGIVTPYLGKIAYAISVNPEFKLALKIFTNNISNYKDEENSKFQRDQKFDKWVLNQNMNLLPRVDDLTPKIVFTGTKDGGSRNSLFQSTQELDQLPEQKHVPPERMSLS